MYHPVVLVGVLVGDARVRARSYNPRFVLPVPVAGGTTYLHINTSALLTRTTPFGVVSVMECIDQGFIAEICIKEVKIFLGKPTVI